MSKESLSFINFIFEQDKQKKWQPVPKPKAPIHPTHPGAHASYLAYAKYGDDMNEYIKNKSIYNQQMDEWEKKNKPKQWAAKQAAKNTPANFASSYALKDKDDNPLSKQLQLIWKENQGSYLFIRFTSARQHGIGINPNYAYETPRGTYAYPYNPKWIERIKNKDIPYAFRESGVIIFKWDPANTSKRTIVLDENGDAIGYSKSDYATDYKKLEEYLLPEYEKKFKHGEQNIYNKAIQSAQSLGTEINRNWIHQQIAQLRTEIYKDLQRFMENAVNGSYKGTYFNKIYNLSRVIAGDATKWTEILFNVLNISCIYDREDSATIHGNEPTQAVFFEPEKATILLNQENIFPNTKIKDYGEDDSKLKFVPINPADLPQGFPPGKYFRIVAKEYFDAGAFSIYKGTEGGIVSGPHNISSEKSCWISYSAAVINNGYIGDNAVVIDNAIVQDNAKVLKHARIVGNAIIKDNAVVTDEATVSDDAVVGGKAIVRGFARLYDSSKVFDQAVVDGYTRLYGNTKVHGKANINGIDYNSSYYDKDIYEEIPPDYNKVF